MRDQGSWSFIAALVIGTTFGAVSAQRGAPPVPAPMPPVLRDYRPVTAERLKNPEDDNWLMIRRTYDGWGFSPLTQITPATVARLRPAWVFSTAEARVHQAAPIVNGGVMFVTSPNNQGGTSDRKFHAFDASTGKLLWEFPMNSGALAPPSSFSIDGKQYVAVETGWGGDSRGMQATLNNLFPGEYPEVPEGGAVWVFALE